MFILYGLLVGIVTGLVSGGRLAGLARLELRWVPLAIVGLLVQLALFSAFMTERVAGMGPPLYIGSTLLVLAAVLRNVCVRGMPLLAIGAITNLAAIVANGGFMPTTAEAIAASGHSVASGYSNSAFLEHPRLGFLTDVFALPPWLPMANVFSIGDVLIAMGVAWIIVSAMRAACPPAVTDPSA